MKQFTILLIFNFSFDEVKPNSIFIQYEEKLVVDETKFTTVVNAYLISNGSESLYEEDFTKTSNFSHKVEDNSKNYIIPSEANPLYYKNASNLITYYDFINYGTDFYVNDKIEFEWTITENTKEILGYKCQEAKVDFRGRSYIAYFTSKIPFDAGPWKFHGLPGLILDVRSIDGAFQAFAKKIELKNIVATVDEPYLKEKKSHSTNLKFCTKKDIMR